MNTNCLEGMQCPNCESEGPFNIEVGGWAKVTDMGTDELYDIDWDMESGCHCPQCFHEGTVESFTIHTCIFPIFAESSQCPACINEGQATVTIMEMA
jgi:hypothetical protein